MGAREKLNEHHIAGSLGVAAAVGGLTGSWVIFAVVAAVLVATGVCTGGRRDHVLATVPQRLVPLATARRR